MTKRILIAEDNAGSRELIIIHAKAHGYDVVAVTNGFDLLTSTTMEMNSANQHKTGETHKNDISLSQE
jgi:CheY-like chemotaxis protein